MIDYGERVLLVHDPEAIYLTAMESSAHGRNSAVEPISQADRRHSQPARFSQRRKDRLRRES